MWKQVSFLSFPYIQERFLSPTHVQKRSFPSFMSIQTYSKDFFLPLRYNEDTSFPLHIHSEGLSFRSLIHCNDLCSLFYIRTVRIFPLFRIRTYVLRGYLFFYIWTVRVLHSFPIRSVRISFFHNIQLRKVKIFPFFHIRKGFFAYLFCRVEFLNFRYMHHLALLTVQGPYYNCHWKHHIHMMSLHPEIIFQPRNKLSIILGDSTDLREV
jgi:hypothetical protein